MVSSTAGNRTDHYQGFIAFDNGFGQRVVHRIVRKVLAAREESQPGAALLGAMRPDSALQRGVARLEGVEDRPDCGRSFDFQLDVAVEPREIPQVVWQCDADHGIV